MFPMCSQVVLNRITLDILCLRFYPCNLYGQVKGKELRVWKVLLQMFLMGQSTRLITSKKKKKKRNFGATTTRLTIMLQTIGIQAHFRPGSRVHFPDMHNNLILCDREPIWTDFEANGILELDCTVVSHLSKHSFKYASWLSTHFWAKHLGFKIYQLNMS